MLFIQNSPKKEMIDDAIRAFPDECCGFLFGREAEDRVITGITIVNNAKEGDKRRRFEIAPADYLAAERFAEENKLFLLGVYHSHPNHPAVPSEYDRLAAQPFFSYIILSINNGKHADTRSWRLNEHEQFVEEQIVQPVPLV
jgi:proteasome lid subunit RPN8/RPN11